MKPIFYNANHSRIYFSTDIAPITIIRTDSSDTVPECILTLSKEYKSVISVVNFLSFPDEEKIYQITNIEENYSAETTYTVTAQEVGALICSNRIANEDTFSDTEDYLQTYLQSLINKDIKPELSYSKVKYEIKGISTLRASQVWNAGESLFDYLQKESENHKAVIHFYSKIAREGWQKWIVISITLEEPQEQPKIFLPSDKILSYTIQTGKPEYNAFNYSVIIKPFDGFSYSHKGRVVPKFSSEDTVAAATALNCIENEVDVSPSKMTLNSFCKYAGIKVNDSGIIEPYPLQLTGEAEVSGTVYLYVKPNTTIKCKAQTGATTFNIFTVDALQFLFSDIEDYTTLLNSGCYCTSYLETLPNAKNGNNAGYQYLFACNDSTGVWEMAGPETYKTLMKKNYKYNGNYYYMLAIITIDGGTLEPFSSTTYCIAANSKDNDPRYDVSYMKPIILSALELKAIADIPDDPARNITVEFAEDTKNRIGDELQVVAGQSLFKGVVSSVTETWETGTYKTDIEVKEWSEE